MRRFSSSVSSSDPSTSSNSPSSSPSHIHWIRSSHLAGVVSDNNDSALSLSLGHGLVAVTGETGSGKSLLVARTLELLQGGKALPTLVTGATAMVAMEVVLGPDHVAYLTEAWCALGLDVSLLENGTLRVERILEKQASRLKSTCTMNGQRVTLKTLAAVVRPLVAVVDAASAALALGQAEARLAILDTAVSVDCRTRVLQSQRHYGQCRQRREDLEQELAMRILPQSFSADGDVELLNHWIDELDVFERRVEQFGASLLEDDTGESSRVTKLGRALVETEWRDNAAAPGQPFVSSLLQRLTEFRDTLASLDQQIMAAQASAEALGSLSSPQSAVTAVERARKLLFDVGQGSDASDKLLAATERAHDLLNAVEQALSACTHFVEDDSRGLLSTVLAERESCRVSVEDIDLILLDWNTLARKHGISSYSLPSCHHALRCERDGTVEAQSLLPEALQQEKLALHDFEEACRQLSAERTSIASRLSSQVTARLASLGMDKSVLRVIVNPKARQCTDRAAFTSASMVGLDSVDFILEYGADEAAQVKGQLHEVASSGEKARLLLAIECALPGSVGATCNSVGAGVATHLPPVAVVYDEIDAHVGGHAAVSLASMLADQSHSSQVLSITHSPSVAAIADVHVVVKRKPMNEADKTVPVSLQIVEGAERRKELARMASGDLAMEEAEVFADALIRDGAKRRRVRP